PRSTLFLYTPLFRSPSGIATYSQAGSRFGFGLLWTVLFSYPLMGGMQEICARIGLVTGRGLAGNLRRHFPRPLLYVVVTMLVVRSEEHTSELQSRGH